MTATAYAPSPLYVPKERVIAEGLPHSSVNPWHAGGPGMVVEVEPQGGGDYWYWVQLDGTHLRMNYQARQIRKEPPV